MKNTAIKNFIAHKLSIVLLSLLSLTMIVGTLSLVNSQDKKLIAKAAGSNSIVNDNARVFRITDPNSYSANTTWNGVKDSQGNQVYSLNAIYDWGINEPSGIEKIDPNGNSIFAQQCTTTGSNFSACNILNVRLDAQDNMYIIAEIRNNGTFGGVTVTSPVSPIGANVTLALAIFKTNSAGITQWAKTFSIPPSNNPSFSSNQPRFSDIKLSNDGTIYTTLSTTNEFPLTYDGNVIYAGNGTNTNLQIINRINPLDGSLVDSKEIQAISSGSIDNDFDHTTFSPDGNFLINAYINGQDLVIDGTTIPNSANKRFVASFDSNFVLKWATPLSTLSNNAHSIAAPNNNDVIVFSGDVGSFSPGNISKLNSTTGAIVNSIPYDQDIGKLVALSNGTIAFAYIAFDEISTFGGYTIETGNSDNTALVYGVMDSNLNVTDLEYIVMTNGQYYLSDIFDSGNGKAQIITSVENYDNSNPGSYTINGTTYNPIEYNYDVLYLDFSAAPSQGRILDCRLPSDPLNSNSALVKVPAIIEPNYLKTGGDQFGLDILDNSNHAIVTLDAPDRALYGGGGPTGQSNTNLSLYQQPLSFKIIDSADAVNSPNTPGATTSFTLPGIVGRPMDIGTLGIDYDHAGTENQTVYIYALRLADPSTTSLAVDSDLTGQVVGMVVQYYRPTGTAQILFDNLPAAGYAKDFADFAVDPYSFPAIDDVRSAYTPTNDYNFINTAFGNNTTLPTNTFYDIAADANGKGYSLIGSTDPANSDKTGIYEFDGSGNLITRNVTFPIPGDGGDLEATKPDFTYGLYTDDYLDNYLYYSSGLGTSTDAAMVRVNPDNSVTKSNSDPIDSNFTSAATGYMDKIIFDFSNQIIYYKNGSRTANNPDQNFGKIYCPKNQAQLDNPPPPNPPGNNPPQPGNPPGGKGEPGTNGDTPGGSGGSSLSSVSSVSSVQSSSSSSAGNGTNSSSSDSSSSSNSDLSSSSSSGSIDPNASSLSSSSSSLDPNPASSSSSSSIDPNVSSSSSSSTSSISVVNQTSSSLTSSSSTNPNPSSSATPASSSATALSTSSSTNTTQSSTVPNQSSTPTVSSSSSSSSVSRVLPPPYFPPPSPPTPPNELPNPFPVPPPISCDPTVNGTTTCPPGSCNPSDSRNINRCPPLQTCNPLSLSQTTCPLTPSCNQNSVGQITCPVVVGSCNPELNSQTTCPASTTTVTNAVRTGGEQVFRIALPSILMSILGIAFKVSRKKGLDGF